MRMLLIDDEQLVLDGLRALLHASLADLTLDATASLQAALELVSSVRYEVVLLDWNLTGFHGERTSALEVLEALRAVQLCERRVPVLVISGDETLDAADLVARHGLAGFIPKMASGAGLMQALQVVLSGGTYVPTQGRAPVAAEAKAGAPAGNLFDPASRFPDLTERQADVFRVMARGASDKAIARELGIAESTVKTHVRAILDVVGVRRRGEAVYAIRHAAERKGS